MNGLLILGNQLFSMNYLKGLEPGNTKVLMREDVELCTHFKYHQQKIIFFLSAMRKYAEELRQHQFDVDYQYLQEKGSSFEKAIESFILANQIKTIYYFEIEDKFFEKRLLLQFKKIKNLRAIQLPSPMFLTSRIQFSDYLKTVKKPFMKSFYESQRRRLKILMDTQGEPIGGRWSYDEDNRLPLPKDYQTSALPKFKSDSIDQAVQKLVTTTFSSHVGKGSEPWLPTDRKSAEQWLTQFLRERLRDFGPYEDALSKEHPFINHSVLTPFLNVGLLTPEQVILQTLAVAKKDQLPMNSVEGFVRQIIGWREFIRGIYQNYSEVQETANFWQHHRRLKPCWYDGTTGIEPLDDVIRKVQKYAYAHHIERLMVVGSLMLLLEVDPHQAHQWFMEMFIDSSDWVMGPNVFGMALFSDGGLFATKPYFCGSNYYKKMGPYKKGDWQSGVDGLYWGFIDRNRKFFLKNPRMSMMVRSFDKMDSKKKERILKEAQILKSRLTHEG